MIKLYIFFCIFFSLFFISLAHSQVYEGYVLDSENKPIEYVNIGIVGKGIGTVSDQNGKFNIDIDNQFINDSLKFSCIGFQSYTIKVSDFKDLQNKKIMLHPRIYELKEVVVPNKPYKIKILGYTTHLKAFQGGFKENLLGYECGVYIKNRKKAKLNKINLNIASCLYDTLFYRINIYNVSDGNMNFNNILTESIYFILTKEEVKEKISIDISDRNIRMDGDFLVTIEHIKDLGEGRLYFCAGPGKTYYRKTSQANWEIALIGISISVEAIIVK